MKILVTGASGLVGSAVVSQGSKHHELLSLSRAELDVTEPAAVSRAVREFSPHAVLHCAAYTDVDGCERDPERAVAVNAEGAQWVAEAAHHSGASMIHVSTDYVFDGRATRPYREDDVTGPMSSLSAYGRSKLEGEARVARCAPDTWVIVRTAWLYGKGKGFVDWARARLQSDEELPLIEDQTGSPTYALDLAEALLRLAEGGHRGSFHFANTGQATWVDVGKAVARELGVGTERLRAIRAEELDRPARRPHYSVLSVARYESATGSAAPSWQDALKRYLTET